MHVVPRAELSGHWLAIARALRLSRKETPVDRMHLEHPGNFVLDAYSDMKQVSALVAAAQSGGAKVLVQLAHAGRQTPESINTHPTSIFNVKLDLAGYGEPVPATEVEFGIIIEKFVNSAKFAQDAGFDGVEIHAATAIC